MKKIKIITGTLLLLSAAAVSQTPLYIGETLYIGGDAELFTTNHELQFDANIITGLTPKGFLTLGENTLLSGTGDDSKVVGYIRNTIPVGIPIYPVGSLTRVKPFELITASNDFEVEVGYISTPPENPDDLEDIDELSESGYWDISTEAFGQVTLNFDEEDLELLQGNDPDTFSIAGFNGTDWELIASTVNLAEGYIQTDDFIDLGNYSAYTFAISAALDIKEPTKTINIVTYKQQRSIHIASDTAMIQEVTLFDLNGRLLYNKESINSHSSSIAEAALSNGIIIITIRTDQGTVSRKIVY